MNEKEKQIEEMARVICRNSKAWTCKACNWGNNPNCDAYKNAEKLISEGYRKIPKGSVVVDKEYLKKELQGLEAQARKETAKEIIALILERYGYMGILEDIAKQFGVEVEE